MIRGIDHINIVVADLARSVAFYTEVLGFRKTADVVMEGDWIEAIIGLKGVKGLVLAGVGDGNTSDSALAALARAGGAR